MNKNTILGFVLIGAILLGFSWYNTKLYKEQAREKFVTDSIAKVKAAKEAKIADSIRIANGDTLKTISSDTTKKTDSALMAGAAPVYKDSVLEVASKGVEEFYQLNNDKVSIKFTNKGAQAYAVLIKNYYTYDSLGLYLMKSNSSKFGLSLYANQQINTSDFYYTKVDKTDSTLVMRLYFSATSYIEHSYKLSKGSYLMDFNVRMKGMDKYIPKNVTSVGVDWKMNVPRLEKGYDNEKNYSTVDYKFPNEKSVENLGLRKASAEQELKTKVEWFAFQQQFFSAILLAENSFTAGDLKQQFYPETDKSGYLMTCTADMQVEYTSSDEVNLPFQFYYGPNLFKVLKSYGHNFEKIVPLGGWLIGWINRVVIINCFDFLSKFISNYGIIILILTILIKLVISPLTLKSYMSSAKMKVLKPETTPLILKFRATSLHGRSTSPLSRPT